MASKTKVKVTVKTGRKGDAGTLVAKIPVTVSRTQQRVGPLMYKTKAQLNIHLERGSRPATFKPRRAN